MAIPKETHTQALRAIGQALESLQINAFSIEKSGGKYLVRDWENSYLESISDEVWGKDSFRRLGSPAQKSRNVLTYDSPNSQSMEYQGRARRGKAGKQVKYPISSRLRAVGAYLDKKKAYSFEIRWSDDSVNVQFETSPGVMSQTDFTVQNLDELAIALRNRRSAESLSLG